MYGFRTGQRRQGRAERHQSSEISPRSIRSSSRWIADSGCRLRRPLHWAPSMRYPLNYGYRSRTPFAGDGDPNDDAGRDPVPAAAGRGPLPSVSVLQMKTTGVSLPRSSRCRCPLTPLYDKFDHRRPARAADEADHCTSSTTRTEPGRVGQRILGWQHGGRCQGRRSEQPGRRQEIISGADEPDGPRPACSGALLTSLAPLAGR